MFIFSKFSNICAVRREASKAIHFDEMSFIRAREQKKAGEIIKNSGQTSQENMEKPQPIAPSEFCKIFRRHFPNLKLPRFFLISKPMPSKAKDSHRSILRERETFRESAVIKKTL